MEHRRQGKRLLMALTPAGGVVQAGLSFKITGFTSTNRSRRTIRSYGLAAARGLEICRLRRRHRSLFLRRATWLFPFVFVDYGNGDCNAIGMTPWSRLGGKRARRDGVPSLRYRLAELGADLIALSTYPSSSAAMLPSPRCCRRDAGSSLKCR